MVSRKQTSPLFCLLALAAILTAPARLYAASWESAEIELDRAPIEEILSAINLCRPEEIPRITFLSKPEAMKTWPQEYVQLRWAVQDSKGSSWTHPVYIRKIDGDDAAPGEKVASIWMRNFKASDLPEGIVSYYIVTRCGAAHAHVGKVPAPVITSSPDYALRGTEIIIQGGNFMEPKPGEVRRVLLAEPGATREIEVVSWSEKEIRARVSDDVVPGERELSVEAGLNDERTRTSNRMPLKVVKQAEFPAINLTHVIQNIFSKAKIRLNTHKPRRDSTPYTADDSYVSLETEGGSTRLDVIIDDYSFDAGVDDARVSYYMNDVNLDTVRVQARENDFLMTMYFEDLHDEYIAEVTGLSSGARLAKPPAVQIENLRAVVAFNLNADDGLVKVEPTKVEILGDLRGSAGSCDYAGVDVCRWVQRKYENDVVNQLAFLVAEMITSPAGSTAISKAIEPWHASKGMSEITRCELRDNTVVLDYVPR